MSRFVSLLILVVLVLALVFVFYQVMLPFVLPLFLAALLTVLFRPLHEWMIRHCHGHDRAAAGLATLAILLIVLVPIGLVLFKAASEAVAILLSPSGPQIDRSTVDRLVAQLNQRFGLDLVTDDVLKTIRDKAQEILGPLAAKTPAVLGGWVINALVTVLALYYFLADGHELTASAMRLIPLDDRYQRELVNKFVETSRAVTSASLLAAIVQGLLIGVGLYFTGLPGLFLLVMLTIFTSFIPMVGSAIVWVSCALWIYFSGHVATAILFAAWSGTVAVVCDNLLKSLVLHGQAQLHPLLALLSVLGGVQMLGLLGIFVGPMVVAFLQAGLKMLNVELHMIRQGDGEA